MKAKTFLLTFAVLTATTLQAKIWRLNNNPEINADFSDLQTAMSNTPAGDTLYIEGSQTNYSHESNLTFCLQKKLIIVGPGYYFQPNDSTLYSKWNAKIALPFSISTDADGSKIEGLEFASDLLVGANDIVVSNNYIHGWVSCAAQRLENSDVRIPVNTNNIKICKNYLSSCLFLNQDNTNTETFATNCIISNNIIQGALGGDGVNTLITNNIVLGLEWLRTSDAGLQWANFNTTNCIIQNNIYMDEIHTGYPQSWGWVSANNTLSNNVQRNSKTFLGNVFDKDYEISPEGNAYKTGIGGEDCGVFSGSDPYVLNGLPSIPHIYDIIAPTTGTSATGITVKIKVKSQK